MVEKSVTDGRRIGELLASELDGLSVGPLADVTVVDADPGSTPSPAGTHAYGIAFEGERIGSVRIRPGSAVLAVSGARVEKLPTESNGLSLADGDVVVEQGAAVKRAVDALSRHLDG